tara:strand:+ start:19194 stop:19994 length:801 start_codon:yes stop_codon:yes gene_type:complete
MSKSLLPFLTLSFCLLLSSISPASDLEREKRIAENIKDSIVVGNVLSLQANGTEFIGLINNEGGEKITGSVIILHGMGANPNAPQIIAPLRNQLAELGWVTIAIQLPLAAADGSIDDYLALIKESTPRIQTTLDYVQKNFPDHPCAIVAHSLGAVMATYFLSTQEKPSCATNVMIGLPTLASDLPEANSVELLKKINTPIFDIYGSQDLASVKTMAPSRKMTMMKNNPLSRQVEIPGADHTFTGLDDTLVRSIHSWLIHTLKQTNH